MKRCRTSGKGQGATRLALRAVNFGLKVEVRSYSYRQIYLEMNQKIQQQFVFVFCVSPPSMTMAAAGVIRCVYLPDGNVQ